VTADNAHSVKPLLVDLFCGAGGASVGYSRAGFEIFGVDINPQPHYPFEFVQADAMEWLRAPLLHRVYDAIHASPPCQAYANVTGWTGDRERHPDLLEPAIERLRAIGLPWVVENVPEARPEWSVVLCGSQFGLGVRRHRGFLTSWPFFSLLAPCTGHRQLRPFMHKAERDYADAMGCDWMNKTEARQAIPPAYTEFIGAQLLAHLGVAA
jgi:hypothetical protein